MQCPNCKHNVPECLDNRSIGFTVGDSLLLLVPEHTFKVDGLSITYNLAPLGYSAYHIVANRINIDGAKWVMHATSRNGMHGYTIEGFCGKADDRLYKLAKAY